VTVTEEGTVVVNNPPFPPNSTLMVSQEDLALLALGELSGSLAFTTGRLRVTGDLFLAMTWIDRLRKGPL
jgi:putative sterol carrier protein